LVQIVVRQGFDFGFDNFLPGETPDCSLGFSALIWWD
jgi:hypothetical protein